MVWTFLQLQRESGPTKFSRGRVICRLRGCALIIGYVLELWRFFFIGGGKVMGGFRDAEYIGRISFN